MTANVLPAVQTRAQRTRDRLLDSAEALLRDGGPDAATVPAIARRAKVAVGSVYRRFADKDAVLRGAYDRFFATFEPRLAAEDPDRWRDPPLDQVIPALINGIVAAYRAEAPLLAGLIRYADGHQDGAYRQHATALRAEAVAGVRRLLLSRSKEIGHPEPEAAVDFMLFTVAVVLKGVLLDPTPPTATRWAEVNEELQIMAVRYLGIAW